MNEPTNDDVLRQLRELQAKMNLTIQPMQAAAPVMAPQAMQPQPMAAMMPMQPAAQAGPVGLLVQVSIPTPDGEATCHLQFGPEAAANPQAVIHQLMQAGWPVKVWRSQGGGGGFGGGGGGFNRGGGGGGFGGRGRW